MNRKEAERLSKNWLHRWIPDIACNPTDTDLMAIKSLADSYLRTYKKGVKEGRKDKKVVLEPRIDGFHQHFSSCKRAWSSDMDCSCRRTNPVTPITKWRKAKC